MHQSLPQAKSQIAGVFDLGRNNEELKNGPMHVECSSYKNELVSAMEGELTACFVNCQKGVPIQHTLVDMGYPQSSSPIDIDNSPTEGFINENQEQIKSSAIEMNFYWLRYKARNKEFYFF